MQGDPTALKGHRSTVLGVAFRPDGKVLASTGKDNTIRLWNVATGSEVRMLEGHKGNITSVAYSPDGQSLASGSVDKTIKIWSLK